MKLVEVLAKELSKWPDDAHIAIQDPDYDKTIWFLDEEHDPLEFGVNEWKCESCFKIMISRPSGLASDYKTAIVTLAQWQAERDRQKGSEWKRHLGGKQPVADDMLVEVRHRDGEFMEWRAREQDWNHVGDGGDIMQYRIISQPQAEEVEVNIPNAKTLETMDATDRDEGLIRFENTDHMFTTLGIEAKTDQIDGPIKWRDTVNELDAYIEEFTREREALINRLAEEGFALLPAMTAVMGGANGSIPIEEWQVGDVIRVIRESSESYADAGRCYSITALDDIDPKYELDNNYYPRHEDMEFVSRP